MNTNKCPRCGSPIYGSPDYCYHCNERLHGGAIDENTRIGGYEGNETTDNTVITERPPRPAGASGFGPQRPPSFQPGRGNEPNRQKKSKKSLMYAICAAVFVVFCVGGFFLYRSGVLEGFGFVSAEERESCLLDSALKGDVPLSALCEIKELKWDTRVERDTLRMYGRLRGHEISTNVAKVDNKWEHIADDVDMTKVMLPDTLSPDIFKPTARALTMN